MKNIHIEFSDERLITPSGLVFVGQILGKSSFVKKINRAPISKDYLQKQIKMETCSSPILVCSVRENPSMRLSVK